MRPISARSRPSSPLASRLSIQASSTAKSGTPLRVTADAAGGVGVPGTGGAAAPSAAARSSFAAAGAGPESPGAALADAVTKGRLLPPAKTVTLLSDSIRTAISAPTRLRRSARMRPVSRPVPETPTSAFGALATTVPSASRTTMSRMRSDVRPFASRSIWVPPISTSWPAPKFSLIAAVSHGVAISSSIGPLESRHHRATIATSTRPQSEPLMRTNLRRRGPHSRSPMRRESVHVGRDAGRTLLWLRICGAHRSALRLASSLRRASRSRLDC